MWHFSNILPNELADPLEDFTNDNEAREDPTGLLYLAKLKAWQTTFPAAGAELRRRNIEASPAFKKMLKENLKTGGYNYEIESRMYWDPKNDDDNDIPAAIKRRLPRGVMSFSVTTPPGLRLTFVKDRDRFKIFSVWMYPFYVD